jgi:hypothetical protein
VGGGTTGRDVPRPGEVRAAEGEFRVSVGVLDGATGETGFGTAET